MNKQNRWLDLTPHFFRRPSKEEQELLEIKAVVLPGKENIILDEYSGYTRTKIQIQDRFQRVYREHEILEINEPYFESLYGGHRCLFIKESYEPLVEGEVYTFLINPKKVACNSGIDQYSGAKYKVG